ncbi:MAG TPA: hypothetical protein DCZ82_01555 [Candidatus Levybacteria bacterium]|nr:hypothetical protein [Candidatus Levybacteria bacterium]
MVKKAKFNEGSILPQERVLKEIKGRIAVYIDAANLEKSVQELGLTPPSHIGKGKVWRANKGRWRVNYEKLYKFFRKNANVVSTSFYSASFQTQSHDKFLAFLKRNGYRLVTKPLKYISDYKAKINRRCKFCGEKNEVSISFECSRCHKQNDVSIERKANFDVEISIDAVSWLQNYDTFVLFSGDSDFAYLAAFLKKRKKSVVILSRRGHIADELRNSPDVDYYQDIYELREEFLEEAP